MKNIVETWNDFFTIANSGALNGNEQIVLIHIIGHINRNMWRDTKIDLKIIAAAISKDVRTVKNSVKKLLNLGIITESEGGYNFGKQPQSKPRKSKKRDSVSKQPTNTSKSNSDEETNNESEEQIDGRENTTSGDNVGIVATSTRRRRVFH